MQPVLAQPGAAPLPAPVIEQLLALAGEDESPSEVIFHNEHSNDFAEIRLADGRTLIGKAGRYEWSAARFRTSLLAAELLRLRTSIVVPRPLPVPRHLDERPLEAYWRIDLPTLQEVWPELEVDGRERALWSWGELLARLHALRLPGCGPLLSARQRKHSLPAFLRADIGERLLPAITGSWSAAVDSAQALLSAVSHLPERRSRQRGRFLHNDLHMGNVLCERQGDEVRCVGLLDLEAAMAGPVECDLASLAVHHGPLFEQPLSGAWFEAVANGYGAALDPWLLCFFRGYHLLNMGFYSALIGHEWHAARVADAARAEVTRLETLRSTRRANEVTAP